MIVKHYETEEEWLDDRKCSITGSKLHDVEGHKMGFYQLIADRLSLDDGSIDGRERGKDMEGEALDYLEQETGIAFKRDLVMWISDSSPFIRYSPDGYNDDETVAAEAKNLGSARHIELIIKDKLPAVYFKQIIQAFVVNEKLERLFFISYDSRVTARPAFIKEFTRDELEGDIERYIEVEQAVLAEVDEWVERLAF